MREYSISKVKGDFYGLGSLLGKCPICGEVGKLPKDKKAQERGYRLCVNPGCNNSVYKVKE